MRHTNNSRLKLETGQLINTRTSRFTPNMLVSLLKNDLSLELGETLVHVEVSKLDDPPTYSHSFKYKVPSGLDKNGKTYGEIIVYTDKSAASDGNSFSFDLEECRNKDCKKETCHVTSPNQLLVANVFHTKPKEHALQAFGTALFKALFSGYAGQLLKETNPTCRNGGIYLQLNDNDDIDAIPWEYAKDHAIFLVHQRIFARVRNCSQNPLPGLPLPSLPLSGSSLSGPPLRIIAVVPDPVIPPNQPGADLTDLNLSEQFRRFINGFTKTKKAVKLERVFPPTVSEMDVQLMKERETTTILHFMGHCGQKRADSPRALILEHNDNGRQDYIDASRFVSLPKNLRLVFLSACNSRDVARALGERGVPYTIGSNCSIPDDLARQFEFEFYKFLTGGSTAETAMWQVRASLQTPENIRRHSYFAGAMVFYSSKFEEDDGVFQCEDGNPNIDFHEPFHNLTVLHTAPILRGYKTELDKLYCDLSDMVNRETQVPHTYTIKGIGGQEFVAEAMRRMAHLFPGGIFVWAFDKEITSAMGYFRRLVEVIFPEGVWKHLTEQYGSDIEKLGLGIIREFRIRSNATCLLILHYADILNLGENERNVHAMELGVWLRQVTSEHMKILVTSNERLGWCAGGVLDLQDSMNPDISSREYGRTFVSDIKKRIHTYFAEVIEPIHFYGVPPENFDFVERSDILARIEDALGKNGTCRILALRGLGGMGKTQLMLRYCYLHRNAYDYVFWLNVDCWKVAIESFRKLATKLGIDEKTTKGEDSEEKIMDWIHSWFHEKTKWLLLLDGADNEEMSRKVFKLIPRIKGTIILTTRMHIPSNKAMVIRIDKMHKQEAMFLLYGVSSMEQIDQKTTDIIYAQKIVAELDCMPLAINLTRTYIKRTQISFKDYLVTFKERRKRANLLKYSDKNNSDQYEHSVATVWQTSLNQMQASNPAAVEVLKACAFLHSENIPVCLFKRQYSRLKLISPSAFSLSEIDSESSDVISEAIAVLVECSFVTRTFSEADGKEDPARDLLTVHRLVQKVIYDPMDNEQRQCWTDNLAIALNKDVYFPYSAVYAPRTSKIIDIYLSHIRHFVTLLGDFPKPFASKDLSSLLDRVIWYLLQHGIYFGIDELAQFSPQVLDATYKLKHLDTTMPLNDLVKLYESQGKYDDAEPLYQRALAIREKMLGSEHPDIVILLNNLARFYRSWGKYDEAEMFYKRALVIREKVLGPKHLDTVISPNSQTKLHWSQAKHNNLFEENHLEYVFCFGIMRLLKYDVIKKLSQFFRYSDSIINWRVWLETPLSLSEQNNIELASLYRVGNSIKAVVDTSVLEMIGKIYLRDKLGVALYVKNHLQNLEEIVKIVRAESIFQGVQQILVGDDRQADWYVNDSDENNWNYWDSNNSSLTATERESSQSPPPSHSNPRTQLMWAFIFIAIFVLLEFAWPKLSVEATDKIPYNIAEEWHTVVLRNQIPEAAHWPHKLMIFFTVLVALGGVIWFLSSKTYLLYKQKLAICENVLGSKHPDTATSLNSLAELYKSQGKYNEAELLYQQDLTISEKVLGSEHPDMVTTLNGLAELYKSQGKYDEAEPLYKRALAIREKVLGLDHPDITASLNNLATVCKSQRKYDEAEPLYNRSLAIREKVSLSAQVKEPIHFYGVPAENLAFVERSNILASMEAVLEISDTGKILALNGLGGVGKTQLMLRYCYLHRATYDYVFWLEVDSWSAAIESFRKLAIKLGIDEESTKGKEVETKIIDWVHSWFHEKTKWLLLLDNADNDEMDKKVFKLVPRIGGNTIFTTRLNIPQTKAAVIHIDKMQEREAIALLYGVLSLDLVDQTTEKFHCAQEIITELDCMPLAINLARAYVVRTHTSFKGYLSKFMEQKKRIKLLEYSDKNESDQYEHTVATVWQLSFEQIRALNSITVQILEACAFLHPENIPACLLKKQCTVLEFISPFSEVPPDERHSEEFSDVVGEAITVLVEFSFLTQITREMKDSDGENHASDLLTIHRLVQKVIYDVMDDEQKSRWAYNLATALNNTSYYDYSAIYAPGTRRIMSLYISHIRYFVTLLKDLKHKPLLSKDLSSLLDRVVRYLLQHGTYFGIEELAQFSTRVSEAMYGSDHPSITRSQFNMADIYESLGKYDDAESLYQRALAIREKVLESEHPDIAASLHCLARLYVRQGKYDEAEPLYTWALVICEKVLGPEHSSTASSINGLAVLYASQGRYDEAESLHQRALAIREEMLGSKHPDTAESLNNLAKLYRNLGKYDKAEPLYRRALAIREEVLGPTHPDTATSVNNLAVLYSCQGKYEAEPLYRRTLAIREEVLGSMHPDTATSVNNLAALYLSQGKYDEAEPLYKRALSICEEVLGPMHPSTATSVNNLAVLYFHQGKYDEAGPLYRRALAICEEVLGLMHQSTAASVNNLASLYKSQGKYDEAELLYRQASVICEEVLGPMHPSTAASINNLAVLYKSQDKYDEAEPLYRRALAIYEEVLGPMHPETATSVNNLAVLYSCQGKYAKAEPLYRRALAICEEVLGPMHPDTATSVNNLASLYKSQSKYDEAEPLYRRALAIREKVLGLMHPNTATSANDLVVLYESQGKYDEVEPLYRRTLSIREEVLGAMHPSTATLVNNLGSLYESLGKYDEAESLYRRALAIREEVLGPMHPDTATSVNNLAVLYKSQGKYDEAEPLYRRALAIREEVLGSMHPDTATRVNNLAALYLNQGKCDEAEPLYRRALAIYEEVLGPMHPETAMSVNNLAVLYSCQGKYAKAKSLYRRALASCEEVLGPMHPDTATSVSNLASLYKSHSRYDKAEPLYRRALAIREEVLGAMHPSTATSVNNLGSLYESLGKYDEAEPLYRRALAIREEVLGPTHPDTATSVNNLAVLYSCQGKYAKAEPLYKRALVISEEVLGPMHPDTATSMNNLASLYKSQSKYDEAEPPLYRRALTIREEVLGHMHLEKAMLMNNLAEEVFGPMHPNTATSVSNLASLYKSQSKYDEAEPLYRRALAIREEVLGAMHPSTATSVNNLGSLYESLGKYDEAEPLYKRALAIFEEVLGPMHPDTATLVNNLASLYKSQSKYDEAEPLYRRALAICEEVLGPMHPDTATSVNNLAVLYKSQGKYDDAPNKMPYIINEVVLEEMLDKITDLDRADRVQTIVSRMRRVIQHISQAEVIHYETPLERIWAQIQSNALPAQLPNGKDTLAEFYRFYNITKDYLDEGITEFAKTERGFISVIDDLCEFANFLLLIENSFSLRVSESVKVHMVFLTKTYLIKEN